MIAEIFLVKAAAEAKIVISVWTAYVCWIWEGKSKKNKKCVKLAEQSVNLAKTSREKLNLAGSKKAHACRKTGKKVAIWIKIA